MSNLFWGGCDTVDLAKRYGTPLYLMDEGMIRQHCRALLAALKGRNARICYAGKAFLNLAMARLACEEGLFIDSVSEGEFYVVRRAGVPSERITLHGNAKSESFMRAGLQNRVGTFVVDSEDELACLAALAKEYRVKQRILLRVSPGIEAHTHKKIQTAQKDCKFGVPMAHLERAVRTALSADWLDLAGIHVHVGSQLRDTEAHIQAADVTVQILHDLHNLTGLEARELDLGGGFGIPNLPGDPAIDAPAFVGEILDRVDANCKKFGVTRPEIAFEPGRWIVGEAGLTLYTVESVKTIPSVRTYVGVDGGMTDNPRPQLYEAEYVVRLANDTERPISGRAAIAGPCCETGDILTLDAPVPELKRGDILAVPLTGAYNYSMFMGYNCALRPAVIFCKDGEAREVVKRQSFEDLLVGQI